MDQIERQAFRKEYGKIWKKGWSNSLPGRAAEPLNPLISYKYAWGGAEERVQLSNIERF